MDEHLLKYHFVKQLLVYQQGADPETLVDRTAKSAGVHPDAHRDNILDWINYLTATGHLRRKGDVITPDDVSHLEAIHRMMEIRRNVRALKVDPALLRFFNPDR